MFGSLENERKMREKGAKYNLKTKVAGKLAKNEIFRVTKVVGELI